MEKLVLWITDIPPRTARWLVLDGNGNRVGFPQQGALEDAAPLAANRRVYVLLPGERILATAATVPGRNAARVLQAAPYALEENLAGDVESMHVALTHRGSDSRSEFLVTDRDWLANCLAELDDAGITADAAWPDYLSVPADADGEHWLITAEERLLARKGWQGFAVPAADATLLYSHRNDELPLRLTLVGEQPAPLGLEELESARFEDDARVFTELAATVTALPGAGLLQGAFRRKRESAEWKRWRWPAAAAIAWLVIGALTFGLDTWRLKREVDFLDRTKAELFNQALPGRRMVQGQERYLMEQALNVGGGAQSEFLLHLGHVAQSLQGMSNARLNGFSYRNQRLEFSVTVPDAQSLERLRDALAQQSGRDVAIESANSTSGGLEGRIMINGGA